MKINWESAVAVAWKQFFRGLGYWTLIAIGIFILHLIIFILIVNILEWGEVMRWVIIAMVIHLILMMSVWGVKLAFFFEKSFYDIAAAYRTNIRS